MSQRQELVDKIITKYGEGEPDEETLEMLQDLSIDDLEQLLNGSEE